MPVQVQTHEGAHPNVAFSCDVRMSKLATDSGNKHQLTGISVTLLLPKFATQMLLPSKATPLGLLPTEYVPTIAPLLANSLVTLLLPSFVTQILLPSKATQTGLVATV